MCCDVGWRPKNASGRGLQTNFVRQGAMEQRDVSYLFRQDALEHQRRLASIAGSVSSANALSIRQWVLTLLVFVGLSLALVPLLGYAPTASLPLVSAHWSPNGKLIVDFQRTSHRPVVTFIPGEAVTLNVTSYNGRLSTLCVVTSSIESSGGREQLMLSISQPVRLAMEAEGDNALLDLQFKDTEATLSAALKRMLDGNHL